MQSPSQEIQRQISNMLNDRNYLHIAPDTCTAGALKQILNKGVEIAFTELDLSTGCLPKDLSSEDYQRCKQFELCKLGNGLSYKLFGADLTKYKGIVVWHSEDVESMLLIGLVASAYDGSIFHINVSKTYEGCACGHLAPAQLSSCLSSYEKLSNRLKRSIKAKYDALPHEYPCIKRYIRNNFVIVDKEVLKRKLLRFTSLKPQAWRIPSAYAMAKSKLGEMYSSTFWDCLTLELLSEGRGVISEMILNRQKRCEYPLGCLLTTPYLYNGFDLRKVYFFKYFKVK